MSIVFLASATLALSACPEIEGGSVEARWLLQCGNSNRNANKPNCRRLGQRVSCNEAGISKIALVLSPLDTGDGKGADPCLRGESCVFSCELGASTTVTTGFNIPQGRYAMSLAPLAEDGTALGPPQTVVPSPVPRDVDTGQVTSLNVNLIIVQRCGDC